ncbi:hypothetical protein KIN20_016961 [Parelaphostrongylus tenuis]|uniref:Uncharacterized protein n=1 Tax=Parelaphostrongylus tenuis TaxID=148309 RepID=A0AAD5MH89_PARTN|nr:hypothetical protein KIN20_016961 [Parelaphostrongylus tenuis]
MLNRDRHSFYQRLVPSVPRSNSKASISDDYEAYKQYYSIDQLPFHLRFKYGRFKLLAMATIAFLFIIFLRRSRSGVADFHVTLEAHIPGTKMGRQLLDGFCLPIFNVLQLRETLGGVLRCDPEVMKPSAKTPEDVNHVRPADINVIAAMGDSMTVAAYSGNYDDDPIDIYPGNSYAIGGDETLEKHITLANILRIFNPKIVGMSHGTGYGGTVFNVAVNGQTSMDIPRQAHELIRRMEAEGVRLREDWKLISIFIGTNDLQELRCFTKEKPISRDIYKMNLAEGISILRSNLNRTIVSIVSMWNPQLAIDAKSIIQEGKRMECGDDFVRKRDALSKEYRMVAYELQNERQFDHEDFTVVVQGFMDDIKDSFRNKNGEYDTSFYCKRCVPFE